MKEDLKTIIFEKKEKIAWLTLNRPDKLNAISSVMLDEISKALDIAWNDPEIKVLVIAGSGDRAFSAGADISEFLKTTSGAELILFSLKGQEVCNRIERFPKPTIAAINGYALGGGLEIALACDFRIITEKSQLGLPEISIGLMPGWGGTQRLPRLIGLTKAKELIMTGNRISANEAYNLGLVNKVVPSEKFEEEVNSIANKLAEGPLIALMLAKYCVTFGTQVPLDVGLKMESQAFGILRETEDLSEGIDAFLSKRKPKFKGK